MRSTPAPQANRRSRMAGTLLASAAMLLPPLAQSARADTPPERGEVSLRYLNYHDEQLGDTQRTAGMSRDRIDVNALSFYGMMPIAGEWSIAATFTEDSVSGASPLYHGAGFPADSMSGASAQIRYAGDLKLTRYFARGTLSVGASYSEESDYISRGCSLNGTWATESKNTTFSLGAAYSSDTIFLGGPAVVDSKWSVTPGRKRVGSGLLGVTQVVSQNDIVQATATWSHGDGFYSDPYKEPDLRPGERTIFTAMARWNHHFDSADGTARLSYRYYSDSFGIVAHTVQAEYVQPLGGGWEVSPMVRLYSQSAASFYLPTGDDPLAQPTPPAGAEHYSADQRLSAFGAFSYGVTIAKELAKSWSAEVQFEQYRQQYDWCINGEGDSGIPAFSFRNIQFGLSRKL